MESSNLSVHKLETHPTKDVSDSHVNGELTVVWRDWDDILPNPPKIEARQLINDRSRSSEGVRSFRWTF